MQGRTVIREVVNTRLWQLVKFIISDDDLDVDGDVYKIVFSKLGDMDKEQQKNVWKMVIRKRINSIVKTKRNNVSSDLRRSIMGKLMR